MNIQEFNKRYSRTEIFLNIYYDDFTKTYNRKDGTLAYRCPCPSCGMGSAAKYKAKKNYSFEVTEDIAYCYHCKRAMSAFELAFLASGIEEKSDFLKMIDPTTGDNREENVFREEEQQKSLQEYLGIDLDKKE